MPWYPVVVKLFQAGSFEPLATFDYIEVADWPCYMWALTCSQPNCQKASDIIFAIDERTINKLGVGQAISRDFDFQVTRNGQCFCRDHNQCLPEQVIETGTFHLASALCHWWQVDNPIGTVVWLLTTEAQHQQDARLVSMFREPQLPNGDDNGNVQDVRGSLGAIGLRHNWCRVNLMEYAKKLCPNATRWEITVPGLWQQPPPPSRPPSPPAGAPPGWTTDSGPRPPSRPPSPPTYYSPASRPPSPPVPPLNILSPLPAGHSTDSGSAGASTDPWFSIMD